MTVSFRLNIESVFDLSELSLLGSFKGGQCVYLSADRFSMAWENGIQIPFTFFVFA